MDAHDGAGRQRPDPVYAFVRRLVLVAALVIGVAWGVSVLAWAAWTLLFRP